MLMSLDPSSLQINLLLLQFPHHCNGTNIHSVAQVKTLAVLDFSFSLTTQMQFISKYCQVYL